MTVYLALALAALFLFPKMAQQATTFTMLSQDANATMEKYAGYWDDTTIISKPTQTGQYHDGEIVATITIPQMGFYEMPIYYGANDVNNNWQITTPGYVGGWDMFGERGRSAVGAHNYQLFTELPVMVPGEKFIVETAGEVFVYEVTGSHIYDHLKEDWGAVAYQAAELYSVTLMTCYPIEQGAAATKDMYLVYSRMVRGIQYVESEGNAGGALAPPVF